MPTKKDAGDTSTNFSESSVENSEDGGGKVNLGHQELFNAPPGTYPELDGHYILHQTIGSGGSSKVKIATDLVNGEKVAVKIIEKAGKEVEMHRIAREISTLLTIKHPHICKLLRVIHSEKAILLVMEYCPMDLHDFIRNARFRLSESEARRIFIQLMSAVAYLHENGIAHRDLKPENILMDFNYNVKLTDFGLCAVTSKAAIHKSFLRTPCGSPAYCAPELLKGFKYIGSKLDVWSLGVILYVLLCSQLPFHSKQMKELYRKIQDVEYFIPDWVSPCPRDLIERILQGNVSLRPSLSQLWFHPWILQSGGVLLDSYQHQIALAKKAIKDEEKDNSFGEVPSRARSRSPYSHHREVGSSSVIGYIDDPDLDSTSPSSKKPGKSRFTVTLINGTTSSPDSSDVDTDTDNNVTIPSDSFPNTNNIAAATSKDPVNSDAESSSLSPSHPTDSESTKSTFSKIFCSGLRKLTRSCMSKRHHQRDLNDSSTSTCELRELKWSSINNRDIKMTSLTIVDGAFADCILDKLQEGLQAMGISSERIGSTVKNGITSPCKFEFEVMSLEGVNQFCVQRKYIRAKDPAIIKNIIQHVLLMAPKA